MQAFEFSSPTLDFGAGCSRKLASLTSNFGHRVLVISGSEPSRHSALLQCLLESGQQIDFLSVSDEPDLDLVRSGSANARELEVQCVVAIGGGSVLDTAKAIAAMATQSSDLLDHLEVIGQGRPLKQDPLPWIALPTTAGTGSEATRNAVITCTQQRLKVSLRDRRMLPRLTLLDPELALSCPPRVTANSGMDALTQCLESLLSVRANAMSNALASEGLVLCLKHLRSAFHNGQDLEARGGMSLAAHFSGLALASAGLGVVHALASPLGGHLAQSHGALCASMLAAGFELNSRAIATRGDAAARQRLQRVVDLLLGHTQGTAEQAAIVLSQLQSDLRIPRLNALGLPPRGPQRSELIAAALRSNSMKSNPVPLEQEEMEHLLEQAN